MPNDLEARAREATKARFATRLATEDQRNGYEVGWAEGYTSALQSTPPPPSEDVAGLIARLRSAGGHQSDGDIDWPLWSAGGLTPRDLGKAAAHIEAREAKIGRLVEALTTLASMDRAAVGGGSPEELLARIDIARAALKDAQP